MIKSRKDAATGGKIKVYSGGRAISDADIPNVLFTECNKLRYANASLEADKEALESEINDLRAKIEALACNLEQAQTELNQNAQAFKKLREHTQSSVGFINHILKD